MKKYNFVTTKDGLKSTGTYNPNSFNALDAAIAFVIFIIADLVLSVTFPLAVKAYRDTHAEFDYYLYLIVATIAPQTFIFLIAFMFCKIRRVGYLNGGGYEFRFDGVNALFGIILTLGVALVFYGVHLQFDDDILRIFYGMDYYEYSVIVSGRMNGNPLFALLYIYVITPLIPAIVEEGFMRGVIMRGLGQFGYVFAIIGSALMFAIMHVNLQQFVLQFIFGIAVASVVMLTKNFALGCVMHFANNLFVALLDVTAANAGLISEVGEYVVDAVRIIIGVAMLVISVIYFINMLLAKNKRKILGTGEKITIKDAGKYALIDSGTVDESGQAVYDKVVWKDIEIAGCELSGKQYAYNGKIRKVNKKANVIASRILLIIGVSFGAVAVILSV